MEVVDGTKFISVTRNYIDVKKLLYPYSVLILMSCVRHSGNEFLKKK